MGRSRWAPTSPTPTPAGSPPDEILSIYYQAGGVQSFSTTAAGSDTFAGCGDSGGSLSLSTGAESGGRGSVRAGKRGSDGASPSR